MQRDYPIPLAVCQFPFANSFQGGQSIPLTDFIQTPNATFPAQGPQIGSRWKIGALYVPGMVLLNFGASAPLTPLVQVTVQLVRNGVNVVYQTQLPVQTVAYSPGNNAIGPFVVSANLNYPIEIHPGDVLSWQVWVSFSEAISGGVFVTPEVALSAIGTPPIPPGMTAGYIQYQVVRDK